MTNAMIVTSLMLVGMVLMVAEIAILPGFGVAGISGLAALAGAVVYAWMKFGAAWGIGSLVGAGAATWLILLIAPKTRAGKALVLSEDLHQAEAGAHIELKGKIGKTVTALRPAGIAEIDGKRIDVVSDGVFIEANVAVCVVTVDGPRVVVAAIENN